MPNRDYILRLIEQFTEMIERAAMGRHQGDIELSNHYIAKSTEILFGMKMKDVALLSTEELYMQLTFQERPEQASEKCFAFAGLSYQAGLNCVQKGKRSQGVSAFNLALLFTLHGCLMDHRPSVPSYAPKVEEIACRLNEEEFWPAASTKLKEYRTKSA